MKTKSKINMTIFILTFFIALVSCKDQSSDNDKNERPGANSGNPSENDTENSSGNFGPKEASKYITEKEKREKTLFEVKKYYRL